MGTEKGIPIFTFTSNEDLSEEELSAPSESYLGTIVAGLLDTYSFDNEELMDYLIDKPRVRDKWNRESLARLIETKRG